MKLEFERGHHPEIPAAAFQSPEKVGIFVIAGPHQAAIGGDYFRAEQVVAGESVLAHDPAEPSAQGQTRKPGIRVSAGRRRQTKGLGCAVELAQPDSGLGTYHARDRIDCDSFHSSDVDYNPAVTHRFPTKAVTAGPDCRQQAVVARKVDRANDVFDLGAFNDHSGPLFDHAVPNQPCRFILAVTGHNHSPLDTCRKSLDRCAADFRHCSKDPFRHQVRSIIGVTVRIVFLWKSVSINRRWL